MYQYSFAILVTVLHNDDHEVIVIREDPNGATVREGDASS